MDLAISDNGTVTTEYLDDDGELHVSSARWRGSPATRIIGPIYKPEGYFYRWVERGTEPIIMEAEYTGLSPSDSDVFPKPGRRVTSLVYFRDDAVKFDGMWLKKNDR